MTTQFEDYAPKHPPVTIEDLDLPVRPFNILKREGVGQIATLVTMTEEQLLDFRNLGLKDLTAIKEALERHGLKLKPLVPEPFTDVIDVEHVTVYRWGGLVVTVNGDGSGSISQRELDAQAMQAMCAIFEQIREADRDRHYVQAIETVEGEPDAQAQS